MRPPEEERYVMSKDELLRTVLLLDKVLEDIGWHFVREDGFPFPNEHGYWCKCSDHSYGVFYFDGRFFQRAENGLKRYRTDVIAYRALTEIRL